MLVNVIQRQYILPNVIAILLSCCIWLIIHSKKAQLHLLLFSAPECISWPTVLGILAFAVVMLNALVIIMCLKKRSLRTHSMFRMINLAVADMSVGASVIIECLVLGIKVLHMDS